MTLRPWDKKFIDTIFAPNDSLCTALKSAYDNKLKDTQVGGTAGGWGGRRRCFTRGTCAGWCWDAQWAARAGDNSGSMTRTEAVVAARKCSDAWS